MVMHGGSTGCINLLITLRTSISEKCSTDLISSIQQLINSKERVEPLVEPLTSYLIKLPKSVNYKSRKIHHLSKRKDASKNDGKRWAKIGQLGNLTVNSAKNTELRTVHADFQPPSER